MDRLIQLRDNSRGKRTVKRQYKKYTEEQLEQYGMFKPVPYSNENNKNQNSKSLISPTSLSYIAENSHNHGAANVINFLYFIDSCKQEAIENKTANGKRKNPIVYNSIKKQKKNEFNTLASNSIFVFGSATQSIEKFMNFIKYDLDILNKAINETKTVVVLHLFNFFGNYHLNFLNTFSNKDRSLIKKKICILFKNKFSNTIPEKFYYAIENKRISYYFIMRYKEYLISTLILDANFFGHYDAKFGYNSNTF